MTDLLKHGLLACLLLMVTPLHAHLLKVVAFADGEDVSGSVYFSGGSTVPDARIRVLSRAGDPIAGMQADQDGRFSFSARTREDHLIEADAGDGHVARWTLTAEELPDGLPGSGGARSRSVPAASPTTHDTRQAMGEQEITSLVEQAVARQVTLLRQQIVAYEERIRLQDILGGLGYILGLAGLALWWGSRKGRGSR
jgi:nickel transport protein